MDAEFVREDREEKRRRGDNMMNDNCLTSLETGKTQEKGRGAGKLFLLNCRCAPSWGQLDPWCLGGN